MNKTVSYALLIICLLASMVMASTSQFDELQVGPVNLTQDINGVSVTTIVKSFFKMHTNEKGLYLKARIVADLSDLQRKIGQIIDTFPLPTDNCRSYNGNNPVVKIPRKELAVSDNIAVLNISGSVVMWDCRENPIPNSKVEWRNETVASISGTKIKTKVPKVITWPGDPIKGELGSQSFDASLPVIVYAPNSQTAAIKFGDPKINLKGQYAFITEGILSIAGIDINSEAKKALDKAIDPTSLQQTIPEEYAQLNPVVEKLEFFDNNGALNISIHLSAAVPVEKINAFIQLLLNK